MIKTYYYNSREEWLKARENKIGGSDAGAILGFNKWLTNAELWEIKTKRVKQKDISESPVVKYGVKMEPILRELFKADNPENKVYYEDFNFWENEKYPFAHASLDGWQTDGEGRRGILEIKTAQIQSSLQLENWKDKVPDTYFCQLLHYFAVTEFQYADLFALLKFEYKDTIELRKYHFESSNHNDDINYLMEQEKEFVEYVKADKRPPLIL